MATIEIEVADDGSIAKIPEPVQKLIDKAYGKARAEATDESARNMKAEIDKLKKAGELSAVEREKLKTLESDHSTLSEQLARAKNDHIEADRIRTERHTKELADRDGKIAEGKAEVDKRTERVRQLVVKELSAIAMAEGARKESLPELEVLLGSRVGLDDALQAFVRDAKDAGKPALDADGKSPLTLEGFVKQYLADHPHHKAPVSGRGGGARGGGSTQAAGATGEKAQALADLERNPTVGGIAAALRHAGKGPA
jgi:hypothetical protein